MEYGLIVIKPDGVKKRIMEKVNLYLTNYKIEILFSKKTVLSNQDVLDCFESYPFDKVEYSNYLANENVIALLVQGEYIYDKLKVIKTSLRNEYGVDRTVMRNLIHTAACGNEYFYQIGLLFPELTPSEYCAFADMCIISDNTSTLKTQLLKSNLKVIALVEESYENIREEISKIQDKNLTIIPTIKKRILWKDNEYSLFIHLPKAFEDSLIISKEISLNELFQYVIKIGGITILDYLPTELITESLLENLKKMGLSGVLVYDPRRSIFDVQTLEERIEHVGDLFVTAGTNGLIPPGGIAMSRSETEKILKCLGYLS